MLCTGDLANIHLYLCVRVCLRVLRVSMISVGEEGEVGCAHLSCSIFLQPGSHYVTASCL